MTKRTEPHHPSLFRTCVGRVSDGRGGSNLDIWLEDTRYDPKKVPCVVYRNGVRICYATFEDAHSDSAFERRAGGNP